MTDLATRTGLPDALRLLARELPRDTWETHPNCDGLTRFWMKRHLMFRDLMNRLQTGSRAYLENALDERQFTRDTGRLAGFLLNQLHEHHGIEDHHYFPRLAVLEPRLAAGFTLLDADHRALDGHIQALADTTSNLLRRPGRDTAGVLDSHLSQFTAFLDRHLLDEEDLVVPVILTHGGIG